MIDAQRREPETVPERAPAEPGAFRSVLYRRPPAARGSDVPPHFRDLNLDQLLDSLTAGHEEYDLAPFFVDALTDEDDIRYRQQALRDVDEPEARDVLTDFAECMAEVRKQLALVEKLHYTLQKQAFFLEAAALYCEGVRRLCSRLDTLALHSDALKGLRGFLTGYVASNAFQQLASDVDDLDRQLASVRYSLRINGGHVTVNRYDDEADYSAEVAETFERFEQGAVKDYRSTFSSLIDMNHVEARILGLVARLYPKVFATLNAFCRLHGGFLDPTVGAFDREVQFYVAYLKLIDPLRRTGLAFCVPEVSTAAKQIEGVDAFDLPLALKLHSEHARVVPNGFELSGDERIVVVTGPNNGGKTTFARMVGQLHHLASLGLLVPGRSARLFVPDRIFTHFEREESIETLRGKLEDELARIHDILGQASERSLLVMNESFSSTTLDDALALSHAVLEQVIERDILCVYVTFLDELTRLPKAISMVSSVDPDDPAERTFRIERRDADGLAYAAAIARKYGLSYEQLTERLRA